MSANHKRLQFDLSQESVARLDRLVIDMEAASRAEVLRRAIRLMKLVVDVECDGGEVVIRMVDGRERGVHVV